MLDIPINPNSSKECFLRSTRAPSPAGTASTQRWVIPAEPQEGEENTKQAAAEDVKAGMAVVSPAAGGYVGCGGDGCGDDDKEVNWRGGGLLSDRNEVCVRVGWFAVMFAFDGCVCVC